MDTEKIPIMVWLTPHELDLLDRAVDLYPRTIDDPRAYFILGCLQYGLLALADSGDLETGNRDDVPEFVRWYLDVVRQMDAGEYTPPRSS